MPLSEFLSVEHPAITFVKLALGLNAAMIVIVYWALFTKHPRFRIIASSVLLASWPAAALLGLASPFDGLGAALGLSLFPWVISCAVWVTYLQRSRRVRVTFEHQVRSDEISTLGSPATSASSPTAGSKTPTMHPTREPKLASIEHPSSISLSSPPDQMPITPAPAPHPTDEDPWAVALAELDGNQRRPGLWARCFASTNGVDSEARAMYLRERVPQLQAEESARRVAELERATAEAAQHREARVALKTNYLKGERPSTQDVRELVLEAESDPALAKLWEQFQGDTLLHWCARLDLRPEAERLLALGADPCASNGKAQRPHMLAPVIPPFLAVARSGAKRSSPVDRTFAC